MQIFTNLEDAWSFDSKVSSLKFYLFIFIFVCFIFVCFIFVFLSVKTNVLMTDTGRAH